MVPEETQPRNTSNPLTGTDSPTVNIKRKEESELVVGGVGYKARVLMEEVDG